MKIIKNLMKPLYETKAKKIEKHSRSYLEGAVIDIGAGRCLIGREIEKNNKNAKVTSVDVIDLNETDMELIIYDGKNLPFKADSFDSAMIAYVLHHCDDPVAVLKEAIRVCKGNIVIFEDIDVDITERVADFVANKVFNHKDINMTYNFKSKQEWLGVFKSLGLKTVYVEEGVEKEWFYPFAKHIMFVVRK
jgi:ubiquinone/menaquinone biosynthesis C-methylase UbiE